MESLSRLGALWSGSAVNPLTRTLDALRRDGVEICDLITPNQHDSGLAFPREALIEITERSVCEVDTVHRYEPDARGQRRAREAVAEFHGRRHLNVEPDQVVLTPGTSFGYLCAMRVLLEPGDELLVPAPGYPLFDDIAAVCGVRLRRYHLAETATGWRPDLDEIAFQCTDRTRAIAVISPHNPTGTVWSEAELNGLREICQSQGLSLLFDEVFSEFLAPPLSLLPRPRGFPLSVSLNGFSKMFALPGMKVGWMRVDGKPAWRDAALRALEHMADTFLAVGELQQAMIPAVFEAGDPAVSAALSAEITGRRQIALDTLDAPPPPPEGGVYLCCPLPEGTDDEALALELLCAHRMLVHPGHYYDLPRHIALTCLARPEVLRPGLECLNAALRHGG